MTTYPIRRNLVLLSASLTCLSGMLQLTAAVATVTLVLVTHVEGILGLGPAILLSCGAAAALPAGRAMDRHGRIPVLAGGFVAGIAGCSLTALGARLENASLVLLGFAAVGLGMGTVLLVRTAAADMVSPERRPRAISLVLFGAVFGAILGPFVFGPLFAGEHLEADALVLPWLAAAGFMLVGLVLVLAVRPDPRSIAAELYPPAATDASDGTATLRELLRRPGVPAALAAAIASFAVMVAVMNLTGYVMIGHGHHQSDVFPVISAHIVGMYGLVPVVGDLIARIGRRQALVGGLLVMGVSTLSLAWVESVVGTGVALGGLGLGWCFSYVAATAELVDAAAPAERGRLVGFGDLASGFSGAALCLAGGVAYDGGGAATIAVGGAAAVTLPALWLAVTTRRPAEAPKPA
ncbi:MAG: MFS transporter [Gaiellaceae bacterium]